MDIYDAVYDLLLANPRASAWPEMQAILQRAVAAQPRDWQLPLIACEAVGGTGSQAIPAAAAIACLQTSIILIDDMLDHDPRGEYRRIGSGAAANLAAMFQAIALDVVAQCPTLSPTAKLSILHSLNQTAMTTACGQYLDSQNLGDEAGYWNLVRAKSSPFFGTALEVGALCGLAADEPHTQTHTHTHTARRLRQLGELYGEMIQIHDDLDDSMAQPANPDWLLGRSPLPVLFAKVVAHPQQAQFHALCSRMCNPAAAVGGSPAAEGERAAVADESLVEAQTILIRCGAVSYCFDQLIARYRAASNLLSQMILACKARLAGLLDSVVKPVQQIFSALDGSYEFDFLPE
jgi:geranylgeranyl pyrophosphate synthase